MAHARLLPIVFALVVTGSSVFAQNATAAATNSGVFRKEVNEVNLTLTVTDRKGRFVTGLTQENFSILDNSEPPASVHRFQSLTDLPLRLCVLIDSSSSVSRYVKFQQEVAIGFLQRIVRPGTDEACVVKFTNKPVVTQDFTDDAGKLETGVRAAKPDGATAVWDAVRFTSDWIARAASPGRVRRVVVLVTDGDDNNSAIGVNDAIEAALRDEVAVEVVNTVDTPGRPLLLQLAEATGGLFLDGHNAKKIATAMVDIEQSLRSEYFVAYQPAGTLSPGRFRKIQVKTRGRGGRVAYRSGYFVPKNEAAITRAESSPE